MQPKRDGHSQLLPLLLVICLGVGCGRVGYNPRSARSDAGEAGDGSLDAMLDGAPQDSASRDAGLSLRVDVASCGTLTPATSVPPPGSIIEGGVSRNGLTLYARRGGSRRTASRLNPTVSFDTYESVSGPNPGVDPETDDDGALVLSTRTAPRSIVRCPTWTTLLEDCDTLVLMDDGVPIRDDVDGPVFAVLEGTLTLYFNRGTEIWMATERPSEPGVWDARLIPLPTTDHSDPAVTRDGLTLIPGTGSPGSSASSLVAYTWNSALGEYANPVTVRAAGAEVFSSAPFFGASVDGALELYVQDLSRIGVEEPFRVSCPIVAGP